MLTMWDNRCTVHNAQGGYDGHLRLMHRTTIAGDVPVKLAHFLVATHHVCVAREL